MAGETKSVTGEALEKELDGNDIFAQAFAQISEADAKLNNPSSPSATPGPTNTDKPVPAPGDTPAPEPAPAPVEANEGGGESADEGLPPTEAEKAAQAAEAAKTTPPAPVMGDDEIARRIAALVKNATPQEPQPRTPEPQPEPLPPLFSKEDADFLKTYETEYPDIARAETLRRRADLVEATRYIFNEVTQNLRPLIEQVQLLASRTHLGDIQSQVPDYAQTREGVIKWVDQQPAYLKVAYQHVVQQGTAEEVADLIRRFKAETGAAGAQNAPANTPANTPAPANTPVPDPVAQRAIAKLAPVQTKRAASTASTSGKDDFDGAFAEFAKQLA